MCYVYKYMKITHILGQYLELTTEKWGRVMNSYFYIFKISLISDYFKSSHCFGLSWSLPQKTVLTCEDVSDFDLLSMEETIDWWLEVPQGNVLP